MSARVIAVASAGKAAAPTNSTSHPVREDGSQQILLSLPSTGASLDREEAPAKPSQDMLNRHQMAEACYAASQVEVTLTREKILNCPEFYPGAGVNRQYEERIYDYYGRPTYWEDAVPATEGKK